MNFAVTVVVIIAVTVLMKYLSRSSKKQPVFSEDGSIILRMNRAYGIVGFIGIGGALLITVIASAGSVKTQGDLLIVVLLILFFALISVPLVLTLRNVKALVNDKGIKYYGITGKLKEVHWSDIKKVKFSKISLELTLITDTKKVKIHVHMAGFDHFLKLLKKKLDSELYSQAVNLLQTVKR